MIQNTVFILTLVLMGLVLAAFLFVALNATSNGGQYQPIQEKAYRFRSKMFWLLLITSLLAIVITTQDLPYSSTRGDLTGVDRQIDVTGGQWYWQLSDSNATVGETVVFNVSAIDVTHGLGVYDENMRLIGQTQAMPGYSNALKLTFKKKGQYKLLCLEYCGLAHHAMVSNFEVKEANQNQ